MSQPSGTRAPRGDSRLRGAASPPRRGLAERQEVTASRGARGPARRDDGLGRWAAGPLARFEPSALHSRLASPPPPHSVGAPGSSEVDEVRELSSHLSGFIGRARALEQRSLVLRQQLERARRLADMPGPHAAYSDCLRLTEERLEELKAEERRLRRELEAARGEETDYKSRWRSESDYLQRLREDLEQLSRDSDEALSAHIALQIETQILQEDAAFTRDVQRQHLTELRESVELVGQMMLSVEAISPDLAMDGVRLQHEMGGESQPRQGGEEAQHAAGVRVEVEALTSQQRALQDECERLERNLREAEGASEAELSRATTELQARRVELAQALGTLRSTRAENERLWASARDLESELERYRRAIENEDSRLHSVIIGAVPATVHTMERRCAPGLATRTLGRAAQPDSDSLIVRARGRKLAEATSPMEEQSGGNAAPRGGGVFEQFESEAAGRDRSGHTETRSGHWRGDAEEEEAETEAGGDVPDGARLSRAYSKVKNLIREKMGHRDGQDATETSSSEEDLTVYTVPSSVRVSGQASWPQPSCYFEPCLGRVVVVDAEEEEEDAEADEAGDDLDPVPSLGPQPPPPSPRGPLPPAPPSDPSYYRDILIPLDPAPMPDHVPAHPPAPPSAPDAQGAREPRDPAAPAARQVGEEQKDKDDRAKDKDERGKDGGTEPCRDADKKKSDADDESKDGEKKSRGKTTPSPPQEVQHEVEKNKSATDSGGRALGRPEHAAPGEFTSSSISYEKLEVVESTETTVDDKRQDYEEKSLVIETSVERKETFSSH